MTKLVKCTNCSGTGRLNHFAHIDNGVCYACNGTGKVKPSAETNRSAWNQALDLLDEMRRKGWITEQQHDTNVDWCVAKHKSGMPSSEILEAVNRSYQRNKR